jgi:predicted permease
MLQRRREIGVRLALGVTRGRLMRLLLTEAALIAAIAAVVALGVAYGASHLVQRVLLPDIVWSESVLDARVLGVTLAAGVACVLLAGLGPALVGIGTQVSESLKAGSRQVAGGRNRVRFALMTLQAALSIVLLIGAGLFVRSLRNVVNRDVGIDRARVLRVTMPLGSFGFDTVQSEDIYRMGVERARALPGVTHATVVRLSVPMGGANATRFAVPEIEQVRFGLGGPYFSMIGADFFPAVGAPIVRGRNFTEAEARVPSRVLIVNELVARGYWPGGDPVGKCARVGSDTLCSEIVGVARNVMQFRLILDERAMVYVPSSHPAFRNLPPGALLVRVSGDAAATTALVRRELQQLASSMPFVTVKSYEELVAPQLRPWRLGAAMFTLFGVIALLIAAVGLYSVMAFWVSQRTQEIGVRMALGAQRTDVVRLVAWQSSRAVGAGLLLGAIAAALSSRWIAEMLYETSPRDPLVYGIAAVLLAVAALLASIVPARRSAAIDPATAIRTE